MMLLGRYSRLVLDSWTRPTYARLRGRKAADRTIERRFRRYRDYAGSRLLAVPDPGLGRGAALCMTYDCGLQPCEAPEQLPLSW